jgi:hypothetical protein
MLEWIAAGRRIVSCGTATKIFAGHEKRWPAPRI